MLLGSPRQCLTIVAALAFTLTGFSAENLLSNPGFEDGTNSWTTFQALLTASSANPFSGNASGAALLGPGGHITQNVLGLIQPGQSYQFGGYFRSQSNLQVSLEFVFGDGRNTQFITSGRSVTTNWNYLATDKGIVSRIVTGALVRAEVRIRNSSSLYSTQFELDGLVLTNSSPRLTFARSNEFLNIIWPKTATNYVLQATAGFSVSNWSTLSPVQTNSTTYSLLWPIGSNSYFRLIRP